MARGLEVEAEVEEDEADGPGDVFEVEKIVAHELKPNGSLWYKIKWAGVHGADEFSWEPESSVRTGACISDYWSKRVGTLVAMRSTHGYTSFSRPSPELQVWLDECVGDLLDVDLFARDYQNPLCRRGVRDFARQAERAVTRAKTIWINPPWFYYHWIGHWLAQYGRGKRVVVLVPEMYGPTVEKWPVTWNERVSVPTTLASWFVWPDGTTRPVPAWGCAVWFGAVASKQ